MDFEDKQEDTFKAPDPHSGFFNITVGGTSVQMVSIDLFDKMCEENEKLRKQIEIAVSVLTLVDSANEAWLPNQAREALKAIQNLEKLEKYTKNSIK